MSVQSNIEGIQSNIRSELKSELSACEMRRLNQSPENSKFESIQIAI